MEAFDAALNMIMDGLNDIENNINDIYQPTINNINENIIRNYEPRLIDLNENINTYNINTTNPVQQVSADRAKMEEEARKIQRAWTKFLSTSKKKPNKNTENIKIK